MRTAGELVQLAEPFIAHNIRTILQHITMNWSRLSTSCCMINWRALVTTVHADSSKLMSTRLIRQDMFTSCLHLSDVDRVTRGGVGRSDGGRDAAGRQLVGLHGYVLYAYAMVLTSSWDFTF